MDSAAAQEYREQSPERGPDGCLGQRPWPVSLGAGRVEALVAPDVRSRIAPARAVAEEVGAVGAVDGVEDLRARADGGCGGHEEGERGGGEAERDEERDGFHDG